MATQLRELEVDLITRADLPELLFLCVHNAGRSQMAAALLDHGVGRFVDEPAPARTP